MQAARAVAAALVAGLAWASATPLAAKTIRQVTGPAEIPPASFKGRQYVDSTGCVFIRAGSGAQVTWVPRADRKGNVVCGYKPMNLPGARPAQEVRTAPRQPAYVEITPDQDVDEALARLGGASPAPKASATSAPRPRKTATQGQRMTLSEFLFGTPRKRTVAAPAPSPAPQPTLVSRPVAPAAPAASAPTAQPVQNPYLRAPARLAVRTAPQDTPPPGSWVQAANLPASRQPAAPAQAPAPRAPAAPLVVAGTAPMLAGSDNPYWQPQGRLEVRYGPQPGWDSSAYMVAAPAGAPDATAPAPAVAVRGAIAAQPANPYMRAPARLAVRTTPQITPPPGAWVQAGLAPGYRQPAAAVPVPRVVADPRIVPVPPGYRSILEPAKFNPYRGRGTPQGEAMMNLVWTQTVPRRLIDVGTGRDVTATAGLVWPYTDPALQARHLGTQVATRSTRRPAAAPLAAAPAHPAPATAPTRLAALDTGSITDTAAAATVAAGTTRPGRFVQVATFGVPANAARTKARMAQAGWPVASRGLRRKGRALEVVLLGPFADAEALRAGLDAARAAGFADAFVTR